MLARYLLMKAMDFLMLALQLLDNVLAIPGDLQPEFHLARHLFSTSLTDG